MSDKEETPKKKRNEKKHPNSEVLVKIIEVEPREWVAEKVVLKHGRVISRTRSNPGLLVTANKYAGRALMANLERHGENNE